MALAVEAQHREPPARVAVGRGEAAKPLEPAAGTAQRLELVIHAVDEARPGEPDQQRARRQQRDRQHHRQRDQEPGAEAHRRSVRVPSADGGAIAVLARLTAARSSARST